MPRTSYCTHLDVLRKFDPKLEQSDLNNNDYIEHDDEEVITSRVEAVESDFETDTGHALRLQRVGSVGSPPTFESHTNKYWKYTPSQVYLEHRRVLPIDPSAGDKIELRTSKDTWKDITADEGSRWTADYRKGVLRIFSRLHPSRSLRNIRDERFVRLTYRYGALGGDQNEGGQTALTNTLAKSATGTVKVDDASRLPANASILFIDGSEYVRVSDVDPSNDEITIDTRGLRLTQDAERTSGSAVHYCPMGVREAIAAKAARELVLYDDYVDQQRATDIEGTGKIENWQNEYDRVVARYRSMDYG